MAAFITSGCNDPYSQTRLERRAANRQKFFERSAESEGRRPEKLGRTLHMFEQMHDDKVVELEKTTREIGYHVW